ncbi:sensor histidine kinase [Microbacterium sp. HM-570]
MLTVVGIVSIILVLVSIVTSVVLGRVLEGNVDARLRTLGTSALSLPAGFPGSGATAYQILEAGRQEPGFLLVLADSNGTSTGAVVDATPGVSYLSEEQIERVLVTVSISGPTTINIGDGLGDYRVLAVVNRGTRDIVGAVGLPLEEVQGTIANLLTATALLTAGGLVLLGVATAWTIRRGLKPLRAVAETASRVARQPLDQGEVSISERVPAAQADERTEIGRVGAALNMLLHHVDASLDARQRNEERMRRFVADASHELRTPLASIRGYSELSLRDRSLSETSEQSLQRIQAQSLRMTGIVEDLLLLARLDEGQELVYGTSDLSRLVVEAVGDAQVAAPDHGWSIDVDDEPVQIAGDTARLHQVVANLLANARTHTPAGTHVTASVTREGSDAVIRVHDDGPGIDPALQAELFQRFSRGDTSRARQTGGSGLGLSIVRAIVEAHDGTISMRSVPGDTEFEVRLPAKPRDPEV